MLTPEFFLICSDICTKIVYELSDVLVSMVLSSDYNWFNGFNEIIGVISTKQEIDPHCHMDLNGGQR